MRKLFEKNKMLEAIKNGRAPIGFFNYIKDTTILDIAGTVGFDFAIIDSEHAVMDRETIEHMILAAQVNDVSCPILQQGKSVKKVRMHSATRRMEPQAAAALFTLTDTARQTGWIILTGFRKMFPISR